MITINSISFKDDRTNKVIEVHTDGTVTSDKPLEKDEATTCSLYAGLLLGGGIRAFQEFQKK